VKTWVGSYAIPSLVSGTTMNSSRTGPSFDGAASFHDVLPVDSGVEAVQLRNKRKGIMGFIVNGTADGALPNSPEDSQPQHHPQPQSPFLDNTDGQV
jgi:hypothetical protein